MGICYANKKNQDNKIKANQNTNKFYIVKKETDDKETTSLPNTNGNAYNNIKIINSNNNNNNENNNNNSINDNNNNNNNNNNKNNNNNIIIETEKDELIHNTQIENKSNTNYSKNIKNDKNNNYILNRTNTKNDLILLDEPKIPFYYKLQPINEEDNKNKNTKNNNINYSTENDFNSILMPITKLEYKDICYQFLSLNQRNWFQDKINTYSILLSNRTYNNNIKLDSNSYKNFIHCLLKLHEDFNWLLWSMSYYIKNNKNFNNNNNNLNIDINLIYNEGIIYKGIYFRIIKQLDLIKNIKKEIKCLNYSFLDYLQLLDNIHLDDINFNDNNNFTLNNNNNNNNNNYNNLPLLSNYLFFPLISYSEFNGEFLFASEVFPTTIDDNNYDLNTSFNLNDLNYSPIFKNLNKNHLIKINNFFILINTNKLIPNLCENIKIKYSLLNNYIDITKDFIQKSNYISFLNYFINLIQRNKYINDIDNINYEFNKFGINKFFLPYIITKIKGESNANNNVINSTNNIVNLIKIKILVKILFRCVNSDNSNNNKINVIKNYLFSILIPQKIEKNSLEKYLKNLLFFTKNYLLNFYNICFLYFENINNSNPLFSNKTFIKSLILSARKFPFIFVSEIERKFNIIFNHLFKYKISISLENFYNEIENNFIQFNEPKIFTFLNGDEIFFYLFAKNINIAANNNSENFNEDNNNNNINNSIDNISMINRSIIPKDNYNFIILNSSRDAAILNNNNSNNFYNNFNDDKIIEFNYDKKSKNTNKENQKNSSQNYSNSMKNKKSSNNINSNTINNLFYTIKKTPHHLFWKVLSKNYHIKFPPNLYKIIYSNKSPFSSLIYKNLSFYYSFEFMTQTIIELKSIIEFIFNNEIVSINNKTSNVLIYLNIYLFLHFFYIENNKNESKEIIDNIFNFIENKNIYINNDINIIINILCGIFQEKNNLFKSEFFYSKSLIFSLFKYGEPRGKNNEANLIMLLPLYKVGRDYIIIDNNDFINENFKEIFHCLNFCYNYKKNSKIDVINNNNNDITNDLYNNNINILLKKKSLNKYFNNNNFNDKSIENFNEEDDEMLERPSKISLSSFDNNNHNNNFNSKYNLINLELNYDTNNKEISSLPYFIFPSISDKKTNFVLCFEEEHFFIFLIKNIFNCINFTNNFYSQKYYNEIINSINKNSNKKNNNNLKTVSKSLSQFCKYFIEILNFKDYHQNGILFSWGNNTHNETSHDNYDKLYLPRFVYKLKNKKVVLVNSGWEFSVAITNENDDNINNNDDNNGNKVYSWGNNCNGQCGFDNNEFQIINTPKNVLELNEKNIIQISCGNEHCLALNKNGEVYSWGINEDGVLGFANENNNTNKNKNNNCKIFKPTLINFFKENNIKIKYISSGSIHNIVIANSGTLYSFGCSKGGQLGIDENTLLKLYSSNKIKDDFSISTPTLIKNLESFQIKKVVCGEAHSIALTENGKVFVWGLGSYGQLGLGFSDENYEIGTGLNSSRRFVPIELTNDYFKNDINDLINHNKNNIIKENYKNFKVNDVFLGKTISFFLTNNNSNNNNNIYSCGLNDLNQCGFDYNRYNLTYIINPLKIEMFSISMKILKVSCGEGHVLAIVKDNTSNNELIFSWGSNKNGQLGLAIKDNKTIPTIINYFLNYKNKKIKDICCGAYHSFVILDNEKTINVNLQKEKEKILNIINNINENEDNNIIIDHQNNNNNINEIN